MLTLVVVQFRLMVRVSFWSLETCELVSSPHTGSKHLHETCCKQCHGQHRKSRVRNSLCSFCLARILHDSHGMRILVYAFKFSKHLRCYGTASHRIGFRCWDTLRKTLHISQQCSASIRNHVQESYVSRKPRLSFNASHAPLARLWTKRGCSKRRRHRYW